MRYRVYQPIVVALFAFFALAGTAATVAVFVTGQTTPVKAITVVTALVTIGIFLRVFQGRKATERSIVFYARSGAPVVLDDDLAKERWTFGHMARVSDAIDGALAWWVEQYPGRAEQLRHAWDAQMVRIRSTPMRINGHDVVGLAPDSDEVIVAWLPTKSFDVVEGLLRHEFLHVARKMILGRAWRGGDDDHKWAETNDYGA